MTATPQQRYEVIERLDAGGMAEVFRGRAKSLEGFEKQVAIKRVLPNLAKNDKFIKMFLDEAKLSLFLSHANIVSVFDLGQSGDTYFIVMEYVDGPNLKKLVAAAEDRRQRIPTNIAVYIASKICEGLAYAHAKADANGRQLDIVHRDISPPNVLLSWQGEVKITDFGLAKATTQVELTDPGVVKGKFGYLSPEAAQGETVDARTDVFATGIVLWEMLAGRRLFQGKSDFETLQLVRRAEIPSLRNINSHVPPELDEIVSKTLARDREQRFRSSRELGQALTQFLFSTGESVSSYDLSEFINRIVGSRSEHDGGSTPDVANRAIQEEVNRLTRIEASGANESRNVDVGDLEDPRMWADVGFDPEPADRVSGAYASRGHVDDTTDLGDTLTRVRTGMHRTVPPREQAEEPIHTPAPVSHHTPEPSAPPTEEGSGVIAAKPSQSLQERGDRGPLIASLMTWTLVAVVVILAGVFVYVAFLR